MRYCCLLFLASLNLTVWADETQEVFTRTAPSVVTVLALDEQGQLEGQGSGVVYAPGQVITNCHVLEDASTIRVRYQKREYVAQWQHGDIKQDICLLKVDQLEAPPVTLRMAENAVGERVYAVGNPLGLELSVSTGLISFLRTTPKNPAIYVTAPVSPGSSGGGLFDVQGRLLGITTATSFYGQNTNLVIPAHLITAAIQQRINPPAKAATPANPEPNWFDQAEKLRINNDWKGLLSWAQEWRQYYPGAVNPMTYMGLAQLSLQQPQEAELTLRKAMALDANSYDAHAYLAETLRAQGRKSEADQSLDQAIKLQPANGYAYYLRGGWLTEDRNIEAAYKAIKTSLRLMPADYRSWRQLGLIEEHRTNPKQAIIAYQATLRLSPKDIQTKEFLARALTFSGQSDQARQMLGQLSTETPANRQALYWLAIANNEIKDKRLTDAENALKTALQIDPNHVDALVLQGLLYVNTHRQAMAEESLRKALQLQPKSARVLFGLAELEKIRGDHKAVLYLWEQGIQYDPDNALIWRQIALAHYLNKNFSPAQAALFQLIRLNSDTADDLVVLGEIYLRTEKIAEAEATLRKAEQKDPKNIALLHLSANLHGTKQDYPRALEFAERLLQLEPTNAAGWSSKGYILLKMGRLPEAVQAFETAIRLEPDVANPWVNLGETLLRQNQIARGIQALERAVTLVPQAFDAHLLLGQAYLAIGQTSRARSSIELVLKKRELQPALAMLTLINLIENRQSDAEKTYQRLKKANPEVATKLRSDAILKRISGASALPE